MVILDSHVLIFFSYPNFVIQFVNLGTNKVVVVVVKSILVEIFYFQALIKSLKGLFLPRGTKMGVAFAQSW